MTNMVLKLAIHVTDRLNICVDIVGHMVNNDLLIDSTILNNSALSSFSPNFYQICYEQPYLKY